MRRPPLMRRPLRLVLLLALPSSLRAEAVWMKLRAKEERCLWRELDKDDQGPSVEVFVESGGSLKVRMIIQGPYPVDGEGVPVTWDASVPKIFDGIISSQETGDSAFATPVYHDIEAIPGAYKACVYGNRFDDLYVSLDWHVTASTEDEVPIKVDDKKNDGVTALATSVNQLRNNLADLQEKQRRERRRLAHHKAINDASHNAIVEGSLFETAVYAMASAFQIIFVRRWFDGKSVNTVFGHDNV